MPRFSPYGVDNAQLGMISAMLDAGKWGPIPTTAGEVLSRGLGGYSRGAEMDQEQQFLAQSGLAGVPRGIALQMLMRQAGDSGTVVGPGAALYKGGQVVHNQPATPKEQNSRVVPKRLPNGMIQDMVVNEQGAEIRPYGAPYKPDSRSDASGTRKEYTALSQPFIQVRDAYERIKVSALNPSPAGDLALLFNYMKMLDPGSVVRESEFAEAAKAGSFGDRIQAAVLRVVEGEKLSPDQRADFVDRADDLYKAQANSHKKLQAEFGRIAKDAGYDEEDVVVDFDVQQPDVPRIKDDFEYDMLPPGQEFIGPDGIRRRKPERE